MSSCSAARPYCFSQSDVASGARLSLSPVCGWSLPVPSALQPTLTLRRQFPAQVCYLHSVVMPSNARTAGSSRRPAQQKQKSWSCVPPRSARRPITLGTRTGPTQRSSRSSICPAASSPAHATHEIVAGLRAAVRWWQPQHLDSCCWMASSVDRDGNTACPSVRLTLRSMSGPVAMRCRPWGEAALDMCFDLHIDILRAL